MSRRVVATGVVVLCTAALLLMPWLLSGQPVAASSLQQAMGFEEFLFFEALVMFASDFSAVCQGSAPDLAPDVSVCTGAL